MLRLIKTRPAGPFPVATRSRDGELYEPYHPRLAAIRHLRELLADGRAGLDPYDETILLVDATDRDLVWTHRSLELCGLVVNKICNWQGTGGTRYRSILEADVRQELGLDQPGAPRLGDEPLASRRLREVTELTPEEAAGLSAAMDMLENPQTPVLQAVAAARDAQERAGRSVH